MKKTLTIFFTLLLLSGISSAQQATVRDMHLLVSPPEAKSATTTIAELTNPWKNGRNLMVVSPCVTEQIPVWWRIQSYLPNGCLIVYLGNPRIGQQVTILYGQPLPPGWIMLTANQNLGTQVIKYVGK